MPSNGDYMSVSDEVDRGIRLQNLIREEFSRVDPEYERQQLDGSGNLIYGPTVSFIRTGAEFRYNLAGCGDRYQEFEAALHRVIERFGRGEGKPIAH
jgi:hypothetical protein